MALSNKIKKDIDTPYSLNNFRKLCEYFEDNNHELMNLSEDIDNYKDKAVNFKLSKDDGEYLIYLTHKYVDLNLCYRIAQEFKTWDNKHKYHQDFKEKMQ